MGVIKSMTVLPWEGERPIVLRTSDLDSPNRSKSE